MNDDVLDEIGILRKARDNPGHYKVKPMQFGDSQERLEEWDRYMRLWDEA